MKTNILVANEYTSGKESRFTWYKWEETCDKCGKTIQDHSTICAQEPNTHECDFCADCMREFMNKGISYADACKLYGKDNK